MDEYKPDLGINLKIAQRIRQSGVVLEPDAHFEEVTFQSIFSIVLRFMIAWVPINCFLVALGRSSLMNFVMIVHTWHAGRKSHPSREICLTKRPDVGAPPET
jgi:hypothetical protein